MPVHINGFRARSTADMVMLMTTSFLRRRVGVHYKFVSIGARAITMSSFIMLFAVIAQ